MIKRILTSQRFRRHAKESSWIVVGQITAVLGALVLVRVLTDYLEPAEYGQLALGLTVAGLVNQVVLGGLSNGISRFYSIAAEANDLPEYLRASRRMMEYGTVAVLGIAMLLMMGLFWTGYSEWIGLIVAAIILSVLAGYNNTLSGIQNAARQRAIVAFHRGLDAWLKILLAVGVMLLLGNTSISVVLGFALASLLVTTSQLFFLRRLIRHQGKNGQLSNNWGRQMWMNSWPFATWGIFTWAQQSSDRWALAHFISTDVVGGYVVLTQIGMMPILTASGMLITLITPILFQRVGNAEDYIRVMQMYVMTRNMTIIVMIAIILFAITAFSLHELIFDYLVNERYHKYSYLMPWLVVAAGFQTCHHILGIRISATLKVRSIVIPQIISALTFVLLNVIGTLLGGVEGLVCAQVVASFLFFFWMFVLTEIYRYRYMNEKVRIE